MRPLNNPYSTDNTKQCDLGDVGFRLRSLARARLLAGLACRRTMYHTGTTPRYI